MQDRDTIDFNKIEIVKPTTKQLCMRTQGECTYWKFDASHPTISLPDWSCEDWDGNKTKAREQCPLLDFSMLEKQICKMLKDRAQDLPEDTTQDNTIDKQEKDLVNSMQDLTLDPNTDVQNSTDVLASPLDVPKIHDKGEDGTAKMTTMPTYKMRAQEAQLQNKEEKYRIYMSTFSYEGDDTNLDSETESDSDTSVYPYLG